MKDHKSLRVSIVIPVYNEGDRIAACLRSIRAQRVRPYEVIVVDNNSSDTTLQIVRRFKGVRLLTAKRQGVVHARNRGFNAARGEIIARIDADTRLPRDWVEKLETIFTDKSIDAVSGAVSYYDLPCRRLAAQIDLRLRRHAASRMGEHMFLQGANMALRSSAWRAVRGQLCLRGGLHEDFDLAIHLSDAGRRVVLDERLKADISARFLDDTSRDFWTYTLLSSGTYAQHDVEARRHMYPMVVLALTFHLPLRWLYRQFNNIETDPLLRVNPATFVD
jgi:glycosyltransferase involved in cell wall biosynthesis